MKKFRKLLFALGIIIILFAAFIAYGITSGKLSLPVEKKAVFEKQTEQAYAKKLQVSGTGLIDEDGESIVLRGLMVPELKKLADEKKFNKEYFDEVFDFGGNVIRIPVHPYAWEQDEYYLWRYLDPVVEWAVARGLYVILDMHFIGNINLGTGEQMPAGNAQQYAEKFWTAVAEYFKDVPNVLFEIYNEPAQITSSDWEEYAPKLVELIRGVGAKQVIIASSPDYCYDLSGWREMPLKDDNVMYSAHIFPNRKGIASLEVNGAELPVIVTEWGYIARNEHAEQRYLVGTMVDYAAPMLEKMDEMNISWVACWYDDGWEPPFFKKNFSGLTEWGKFVKDALNIN